MNKETILQKAAECFQEEFTPDDYRWEGIGYRAYGITGDGKSRSVVYLFSILDDGAITYDGFPFKVWLQRNNVKAFKAHLARERRYVPQERKAQYDAWRTFLLEQRVC